jgi:uncharacterized NAD(P)/FAD-binding protein YdhS
LRTSGQLDVHRARIRDLECGEQRCAIMLGDGKIDADRVIDCTGLATDIRQLTDPLVATLLAGGIIRPGPHGIGIDTDASGTAIGKDGLPDPRLSVIGSMRIGTLWESVAIPELRVQAAELAERLCR